jgi:hypothetical protein
MVVGEEGARAFSAKVFFAGLLLAFLLRLALAIFDLKALLTDDSYIFMRYSEHIAKGLGPYYNAHDRVMGFTSPLFTYLVAAFRLVGGSLSTIVLITILNLVLFLGASWNLKTLTIDRSRWGIIPLALWFFYFPLVVASLNGMETTLFLFLATLVFRLFLLNRWDELLVCVALAVLTRPEGLTLVPLIPVMLWLRTPPKWPFWGSVVSLGLLLGWVAYANMEFGSFIPNSLLAKSVLVNRVGDIPLATPLENIACQVFAAGSDRLRLLGSAEKVVLALSLIALIPWALSLRRSFQEKRVELCYSLLFGLLVIFFLAGHPVKLWNWYTDLGSLAFWTSLIPWGQAVLKRSMMVPALCGLAVLCVALFLKGISTESDFTASLMRLSDYLDLKVPNAKSVMISDIGVVGYRHDVEIMDIDGLVFPGALQVKNGQLISFGDLAAKYRPDVICFPADLGYIGVISDALVARQTFADTDQMESFYQHYHPLPYDPKCRDYVYVRQ